MESVISKKEPTQKQIPNSNAVEVADAIQVRRTSIMKRRGQ